MVSSERKRNRSQTLSEEWANAITHGLGGLVSISAVTLLIVLVSLEQGAQAVVAVSIYGASLFLLYLASTLFHSVQAPQVKAWLNLFDHCAIYLLIAGTYTPFLLVGLNDTTGWLLFTLIWSIALAGIYLKLRFRGKYHRFHVMNYVALGWIAMIAMPQLKAHLPEGALDLIIWGGITYTVGVIFYVLEQIPFCHAVWHLFVLGGSTCHYIAVYHTVL
ncbi:MAG: hemolysin III family protein [Hahellaceae bacterium]|jgi:hemolysin III|nr:hemolysin III family protein [Hahellaceae bacterium]